ncbi:secreted RxLR effector protein 161-like [Nicotiana sylvestris]|uniref:secreted RxLR effector protein 161-like n=1 Tax=Nicotiana sylvestris TaxID=4096 RepID=UPI00388C9137
MLQQGYKISKYDHCVYLRKFKDGSFIYVLLYVDDMLIASKNSEEIVKLKIQLKEEFEIKDLVFKQEGDQSVVGYCDSDFAGDLDKRRSTTGYVFTFARAPVSWKSTLQSTIGLSTTEAEYMAITEAVKEAIWLQWLLKELAPTIMRMAKEKLLHYMSKKSDACLIMFNEGEP